MKKKRTKLNFFKKNVGSGVSQRVVPVQIEDAAGGVSVSFAVSTVGEYAVDLLVKNQRLPGAPFR